MNAMLDPRLLGSVAFAASALVGSRGRRIMQRCLLATTSAPRARKIPETIYFGVHPGRPEEYRGESPMNPPKTLTDYYNWLRDESRENAEVLAQIHAENNYCALHAKEFEDTQNALYKEMLGYLKETDEDVPYRYGKYFYYTRTVEGCPYALHCRHPDNLSRSSHEQVILDENVLASGHEYCDVNTVIPSPSNNLLAYSVDHNGSEVYTIRVKDLTQPDVLLADSVERTSGDVIWGHDDSCFYYLRLDTEHRPSELWLHAIGTPAAEDICLLREDNGMFELSVEKSQSGDYIMVDSSSKETSEVFVIPISKCTGADAHRTVSKSMTVIQPRLTGLRYGVEHHGSYFYIINNKDNAKNKKLSRVPITSVSYEAASWSDDLHEYNPNVELVEVLPFKKHIVVFGREGGYQKAWIIPASAVSDAKVHDVAAMTEWHPIQFAEDMCSIDPADNHTYDAVAVRLHYSSFITPKQTLEVNLRTGNRMVLKEKEVPGYDRSQYISHRMYIPSRDTRLIPVSIVSHISAYTPDGQSPTPRPMLLYGYGSYGACIDPYFDFTRLSLLDRGVIYVIAHIRGGGEMGRAWYEDEGKYLTKMNTFHDFGDCAKYLIENKYTASDRLAILGRSAGGLLIGATVNLYPELFKAAVADVPFVDVLATMSDPTIPLTTQEWEEWGNPNEDKYHDYMKKYSPYDNVEAKNYPAMLVTAGLHDPRVAYWEALKWVSKLRDMKTDKNLLLLKTDMSSGHFSASDRYKHIKERAFEFAFILYQILNVK